MTNIMPYLAPRMNTIYNPYAKRRVSFRSPTTKRRRLAGNYRRTGNYRRYTPGKGELKFLDTNLSASPVASTGSFIPNTGSFLAIAQGTGESQRIGRKATIKYIGVRYRLYLENSNSAVATHDTCRVILYWDKQCNGTAASVTDILETANYQSFNNLANKERFRVLSDKSHTLVSRSANSTTWGEDAASAQIHLKVTIPIEYSSTTGAIGEIRSNNLCFLCLSEGGHVEFEGKLRVRFDD